MSCRNTGNNFNTLEKHILFSKNSTFSLAGKHAFMIKVTQLPPKNYKTLCTKNIALDSSFLKQMKKPELMAAEWLLSGEEACADNRWFWCRYYVYVYNSVLVGWLTWFWFKKSGKDPVLRHTTNTM